MRKLRKTKDHVRFQSNTNAAIFIVIGEYLLFLKQNKSLQKSDKIKIKAFMKGNTLVHGGLDLTDLGVKRVLVEYDKLLLLLYFDVYVDSYGQKHYDVAITSEDVTFYDSAFIYNDILSKALINSDIKGKYISLYDNQLAWELLELSKRTFQDIFLPNKIGNELRLYKKVFEEQEHLMRYLMVGIPGTGKTESTLVLANEMMKSGVTIIKTSICEALVDKIRLAELLAPSLIILDDIDLVLGSRNKGGYSSMLKSFLDVLDGTEKINGNVGIIATTNSVSLLDIAARRPGRFDKTIIFDSLKEENIKDIILKSLRVNFSIAPEDAQKEFVDDSILQKYSNKRLTGSHIFNITELLYRKYLLTGMNGELSPEWVLEQIQDETAIVEKIKKYNTEITETFSKSGGKNIGVMNNQEEEDDIVLYADDVDEVPEVDSRKCVEKSEGYSNEENKVPDSYK